jgi:hypothetical protein
MKKILLSLALVFALVIPAHALSPGFIGASAGLNTETAAYSKIAILTNAQQKATDKSIDAIKYGAGKTFENVTAKISLGNSYLTTQASIDLRPFLITPGWQFDWYDGSKHLLMSGLSVGTGEVLSSTELVGDPGFDNAGYWVVDAGATVNAAGNGKLVFTAAGSAKGAIKNGILPKHVNTLYKSTLTIDSISSGNVKFYTRGITSPSTGFTTPGAVSDYIITPNSFGTYIGILAGAANTTAQCDNYSVKQVIGADITGGMFSDPVDGGVDINVASWTLTITKASSALYPIITLGDSKHAYGEWQADFITALQAADATQSFGYENQALTGTTVAQWASTWADAAVTNLAKYHNRTEYPLRVLISLGGNDVLALPAEATFKANYQAIISKLVAKWPNIKIYLTKPWRRTYGAECLTVAGWVDYIVSQNPGVVFVGHDENVWMEGGDDGATMSSDGTHYSAAGNAEVINQWKTALGY